jgi:hypothetical protein
LLSVSTLCTGVVSTAIAGEATARISAVNFLVKQDPAGKKQYVFEVRAAQSRFEGYAGTCIFSVEMKDKHGQRYFGSSSGIQTASPRLGSYSITYTFRVDVDSIPQAAVVAYEANLQIEGVSLASYKNNVTDVESWKKQCTAYQPLKFGTFSNQARL